MDQTYKRLTAKQQKDIDDYCFEMDRQREQWDRGVQFGQQRTGRAWSFAHGQEGLGSRGVRIFTNNRGGV